MKTILLSLAAIAFPSLVFAQAKPATKPNVIFILSDDLGYADIGPYGQKEILTPNLDRFAKDGIVFTDAYSGSPLCAPCRSALLTGLHAGHGPIRHNPSAAHGWNRTEQGDPPLPDDILTFAKVYKSADYKTACFGKWGMGVPGSHGSPDRLGFDEFLGYASHVDAHEYWPDHLWKNTQRYPLDGKTYTHDLFTAETLKYIRANKDHPFMIYLPYTIPHVHLDPPSIAPYEDKPWPKPEKAFAAMITRMDRDIGTIIELLKETGIDNNTLILFAGDNGPCTAGGHKPATFSSTPFRSEKGHPYEGGIRVSFLAHWPDHIPAGSRSDLPIVFYDFVATSSDVTNQAPPANTDGISFLPTLLGKTGEQKKHDYLYWELNTDKGFQEIRMGNWKANRLNVAVSDKPTLELYDLSTDPKEEHNVAADHPDIVQKMTQIAMDAHTPNSMFPLTLEEVKGPPKANLAKPKNATPAAAASPAE